MAKFYTVRPGDNLQSIALNGGTSVDVLLGLNPYIEDPNVILSGQQILLPDTVSRKTLIGAKAATLHSGDEPHWLKIARGELGETEIGGRRANPRIVEYLWTTEGLTPAQKDTDETPWCSAFVNWCFTIAGIQGTNSAWALTWRNWGQAAAEPAVGSVAVFTRRSSRVDGGHVGYYLGETQSQVVVLGGNQGNSVSIRRFPKDGLLGSTHYRFLGCRLPAGD